jgi:hypothetical protein
MLSRNARSHKCDKIFVIHRHFRREKIAKMTNRQLKNYTRKKKNECLKNPRLNTLSVKKLKADTDRFNKAIHKLFPNT